MNKRIYRFLLLVNLAFVAVCSVFAGGAPNFTLVLDAGHGGKDPGAVGTKIYEKTINLNIVLAVGKLVEQNMPDVKVVYTRKTDVFVPLQSRADIANNANGNLFISVHTNANDNKSASGTETYTLGATKSKSNMEVAMRENKVISYEEDYMLKYQGFDPKSVESYIMFEMLQDNYIDKSNEIAAYIQSNFVTICGRKDKSVRQAGFWVLHKTAMPSVLIEVGFISNPEEQDYLASTNGQQKLAEAIYKAFEKFKSDFDLKNNVQNNNTESIVEQKTTEPIKVQDNTATKSDISIDSKDPKSLNNSKTHNDAKQVDKVDLKQDTLSSNQKKITESETKTISENQNFTLAEKTKEGIEIKVEANAAERPIYKLQVFAVSKQLPANSPSFKGLKLSFYQEANLYKYTFGEVNSYSEIIKLKRQISSKFPDAIVISFYKGKKIPVSEAVNK